MVIKIASATKEEYAKMRLKPLCIRWGSSSSIQSNRLFLVYDANMTNGKHSHIHLYVCMYLIEPKMATIKRPLYIGIVNECDLRFSAWSRYYYIGTLYHQAIFSLFCPIRLAKKKRILLSKISFSAWSGKSKITSFFYLPEKEELIEQRFSCFLWKSIEYWCGFSHFSGEKVKWHITKEIVNVKINDLFRTALVSGCRNRGKHQTNSQRLLCFRGINSISIESLLICVGNGIIWKEMKWSH